MGARPRDPLAYPSYVRYPRKYDYDNCRAAHVSELHVMQLARKDEVQKWHTSSRRMSLRRANCLAKINHAGWRGWSCWRVHTCTDHRSRWPLSCCIPRPPRPATSTWRRAQSTRHPPMSMCVRHRPIGNRLTQNPVTDIGSLLIMGRRARLSCTGIGLWRVRTALPRATGLCRTRARLSRALLRSERHYAPERYYAQDRYYGEGRDYALEYAPRPPVPVPYRSRARCDDGYGRWVSCD